MDAISMLLKLTQEGTRTIPAATVRDLALQAARERARSPQDNRPLWQRVRELEEGSANTREPIAHAIASLAGAISLLEHVPNAKSKAPSDKMFQKMLEDYRTALKNARDRLADSP